MAISFFRILRFEEQELRDDQCCHAVLDRTGNEDDALFQKTREYIESTLATIGLLDHHRDQIHVRVDRIAHRQTFQ